mgnify:CR=1 FL=1
MNNVTKVVVLTGFFLAVLAGCGESTSTNAEKGEPTLDATSRSELFERSVNRKSEFGASIECRIPFAYAHRVTTSVANLVYVTENLRILSSLLYVKELGDTGRIIVFNDNQTHTSHDLEKDIAFTGNVPRRVEFAQNCEGILKQFVSLHES